MDFIVDLQGFKRPINEFVLKEISFLEIDDKNDAEPFTLFFEPPTSWNSLPAKYKASNSWLERNFHGMKWNAGDIPYEAHQTMISDILRGARTIYVKGLEKKMWLATITDTNIIDMETLDCPSLRNSMKKNPKCLHHYSVKYNCAHANVEFLRSWLI